MTEHEQLEMAAKALGKSLIWTEGESGAEFCYIPDAMPPHNRRESDKNSGVVWNPANDQADSDRMACQLGIDTLFVHRDMVTCKKHRYTTIHVEHGDTLENKCAAVREARLTVAAEIGEEIE